MASEGIDDGKHAVPRSLLPGEQDDGAVLEDPRPLILDSIGEGVFTVDADWRITYFNAAAERLTGMSRAHAMGKRCHDVFKADICQRGCALRRTLATGEPATNVRVTLLNAEMEEVPVAVSTALLRSASGRVIGAVEIMRDISDVEVLRRELAGRAIFQDIVGVSRAMQEIFRLLPDVAHSDVPVLIQGPSGTGKELVARAIHRLSGRCEQPFLQVNCGALPDTLLESELFGYRRGAFTDARRDHPGRFMAADGGTLLLDEIGDTSPAFQVKLLRVLQEGEVQTLGENQPHKVDVRIIAATNRDLAAMVQEGSFREDLYYRLRVVGISIPPLRERRDDIPPLADHLLRRVALRRGLQVEGFAPAAMRRLMEHDFPGNVRELENIIEQALVTCRQPEIQLSHLPRELQHPPTSVSMGSQRPSTRAILAAPVEPGVESSLAGKLRAVLQVNGWNRERTAAALGISRSTLWRRMKEYGLLD